MDSFTERMLKRVEERRKVLDQKLAAANLQNQTLSESTPSRNALKINFPNNKTNDSRRDSTDSEEPDSESTEFTMEKENAIPSAAIRSEAKKRLKKLGALYSDDSNVALSSPVQQTEEKFNAETSSPGKTSAQSAALAARLAALADSINQRDDDFRQIPIKPADPKPVIANRPWRCGVRTTGSSAVTSADYTCRTKSVTPADKKVNIKSKDVDTPKAVSSPTKSIILDRTVLANLEAQGFARCESHSNLAYDYNKDRNRTRDRSPVKDMVENYQSKVKSGAARDRSPVKEKIESYNKIDATAIQEAKTISTSKLPVNTSAPIDNPLESEKPKQRYGSPRMGFGKPANNVSEKLEGILTSIPGTPAMGVRQLVSPHSGNQGTVLQKAALFEVATSPKKKSQKDPAELPLSQRKALFEQNPGTAVLPKAPFALPVPASMLQKKESIMLPAARVNSSTSVHAEKFAGNLNKDKKGTNSILSKFKTDLNKPETTTQQYVQREIEERQKELDELKNRWAHKTVTESDINHTESNPRVPVAPPLPNNTPHQKTVTFSQETIVNRFSYSTEDTLSTEPDDTFQQPVSPDRDYPGLTDVKKIKVSPPKPGNLYPNLSDMETESDLPQSDFDDFVSGLGDDRERFESSIDGSSMSEDSFGRQIRQVANRSMSDSGLRTLKRDLSMTSSTTSDMSEESVGNADLDEFLDEALKDSESEPTPPKRRCSANNYDQNLSSSQSESFEYTNGHETNKRTISNNLPTYLVDGESHIPLTHTISFYRKQTMNHKPISPNRHFVHQSYREEEEDTSEEDICQQQEAVERRIAVLEQEVSCQQTVISQASQALNLCSSTIEFSGSTEEVEGERLLLVATQRRQAALHEIQRLKVEGSLRPISRDNSKLTERGDLTVSDITLPLKLDNIKSAAREEKCCHLLCLVKSGPQVLSTTMMAAMPRNMHNNNRLTFPSSLTLNGLYSDFKVTVEVYGMSSRSKEVLPHDIKYHISTSKKDTCKLKLTPKKSKHDDKLTRPILQSPGGPGAVRSPKFSLIGYVIFSLREINRSHFTLNKVPYTSVLEGSIEFKLSCQMSIDIEYRGFLTMFDDVSGLGAWHRRWCLLKGDKLSYWKYPDDEKKKIPMDTIDLTTCITEEVGLVSRDICARPHTMLLETSRPARLDDKPSLILMRCGEQTVIRHILSADTKDDRLDWCEHFNRALALLRAWGKK